MRASDIGPVELRQIFWNIPTPCLRWICGFANAEGGLLVIGKDDRGGAVGVAHAQRLLEDIPDKLMIWNPGHLPEGWSIEDFTSKHSSCPSNPDIANAFFRAAYLESWERGIDLIQQACKRKGGHWEVLDRDLD